MSHAVLFALRMSNKPFVITRNAGMLLATVFKSNEAVVAVMMMVVQDECDPIRQTVPTDGCWVLRR